MTCVCERERDAHGRFTKWKSSEEKPMFDAKGVTEDVFDD